MSPHEYVNETTPTTGDRATLKGLLEAAVAPAFWSFTHFGFIAGQ